MKMQYNKRRENRGKTAKAAPQLFTILTSVAVAAKKSRG